VAAVEPRLVHFHDGEPDGVQYERVVVLLAQLVRDLSARVAALEEARKRA
jgi:hypothetical protein